MNDKYIPDLSKPLIKTDCKSAFQFRSLIKLRFYDLHYDLFIVLN